MYPIQIKLTFVQGLKDIVLREISEYTNEVPVEIKDEEIYFDFFPKYEALTKLKSVLKIFVVRRGKGLNPGYISNHKLLLGDLVGFVVVGKENIFKTFKISCAGADSPEVLEIREYIKDTYKLTEAEDPEVKIHMIKPADIWEIGVQITPRPLSVRDYRVENIKGGLNPTVAYAINSFCDLSVISSYLNVFSGSATLLIEAGLINPNLKLRGFDIDKKSLSQAIQNIKKAELIKTIELKHADIFDNPDMGKFDVITSDLPFGMVIGKETDLEKLYRQFVSYCEKTLNLGGKLIVYTTEHKLLKKVLDESKFAVTEALDLKFASSVGSYLYPKVFVCHI